MSSPFLDLIFGLANARSNFDINVKNGSDNCTKKCQVEGSNTGQRFCTLRRTSTPRSPSTDSIGPPRWPSTPTRWRCSNSRRSSCRPYRPRRPITLELLPSPPSRSRVRAEPTRRGQPPDHPIRRPSRFRPMRMPQRICRRSLYALRGNAARARNAWQP